MTLRLLTFNIWFAEHEMATRMHAIGSIVMSKQPELVALQEMTDAHWHICKAHAAFGQYSWSDPALDQRYYTLIGSRSSFAVAPRRLPFEVSLMGRDLLYGTVNLPSLPPLVFATSHLESLNHAKVRREQIGETLKVLDNSVDVVFCGDTNINEADDGQVSLPAPWKDAWSTLRPHDPGYTFDVDRNRMMAQADAWARSNHARLRFDRFWSKLRNYELVSIDLLDEPVAGDVWPSDHFGLLLTLKGNHGTCNASSC